MTEPASGTTADGHAVCSAKGCRLEAEWLIVWRNPRIHGPEREKNWSACGEHRDALGSFLVVRGFLLRVEPLRPQDSSGT